MLEPQPSKLNKTIAVVVWMVIMTMITINIWLFVTTL